MEEPGGESQQEMGLQLAHFIICEKYSWPGLCPDARLWSLRYAPAGMQAQRWAWQMIPFPQGIPIASSGLIPLSSWHSSLPSPKGVFLCLLDWGQDIQSLCFLLSEASVGVGRLMV